jgi:integrase/recombinase XerD
MAKAPGVIRWRGAGWNVKIRMDGRRFQYGPRTVELLRYANRAEVEASVWDEHRRLVTRVKREAEGLAGNVRLSDLLDLFEEQVMPGLSAGGRKSYRDSFAPLKAFFVAMKDDPPLERIRPGPIREYLAWRRTHRVRVESNGDVTAITGSVSPHTVARDYRTLKRLFRYAVKTEYLESDPVAKVEAPRTDPRTPHILTTDEYDRLIAACGDREMLGLYVLVLGETGGRAYSEALHLRWEDVDLAGGFVQIRSGRGGHRTKSGKSRWVPMTPRIANAMREHFARYRLALYHGERTPWVFHHVRDRHGVVAGQRIKTMRRAFTGALARAELPIIRPHDMRHRRVTTWIAEGKPAALVQEAMGHSTIVTTMGYSHLAREHRRALVDEPTKPKARPKRKKA